MVHDTLSRWPHKPHSTLPLGMVQTPERRRRLTYVLVAPIHFIRAQSCNMGILVRKDTFSHLPVLNPVSIASGRSSASRLNDGASRRWAGRTLISTESLIGNFDPWVLSRLHTAFWLEHCPCLVQQRTRRPSCLARLVLVRRFNYPQCYLDITRLCGIGISAITAFNAGRPPNGPHFVFPLCERLGNAARIPVAAAQGKASFFLYGKSGNCREGSACCDHQSLGPERTMYSFAVGSL
ncbi:hypothetical protein EDB84DRAFT_864500 [Lactarius hengduanensis]|nr:hypothetical protein EDB84DRAFT_864500 [Lactarius hengduanensis]